MTIILNPSCFLHLMTVNFSESWNSEKKSYSLLSSCDAHGVAYIYKLGLKNSDKSMIFEKHGVGSSL